jgi:hypothetical protein
MIALIIVVIGYCLMFGAKGLGERLVRGALGLILVLSFLPGVLARCGRALPSLPAMPEGPGGLLGTLFVAGVIALIGFVAWRTRAARARAREERRRLHGSPRERALPQAPVAEASPHFLNRFISAIGP